MNNARTVLVIAAILGVVTDSLFHDSVFKSVPWGLSLFVWLIMLTVASLILCCRTKPISQWKSLWFLVPSLFLAAGCIWRDSVILRWVDVSVISFFLFTSSLSMQGTKMMVASITKYLLTFVCALDSVLFKPFQLYFDDCDWGHLIDERWRASALAVSRGLLIALPIVALFGGLFMAADAAFDGLVKQSFKLDLGDTICHAALALVSTWSIGGFLYAMFTAALPDAASPQGAEEAPRKFSLGVVEVNVVVGSVTLLFLAFVLVQARYFFGGANIVEVTSGLTYADYARRGFFELVTVASLVLPILLYLDWMMEKSSALGLFIFRALTLSQIGFLFVIMLSAVQRMKLYQDEYGFTELRVYTTAFMGWLAIVCAIFIATVLRGQRQRFAFCTVLSGFLVVLGLHVANPDELIVRNNLALAKAGRPFDVQYALSLSNDAVPLLVEHLDELSPADRQQVIDRLKPGLAHAWKADWRAWNWSRNVAYDKVASSPFFSTAN